MTSDIKERYLKNWSEDLNSEMWTGDEMIKFAASIRAETMEWDFELLRILRDCGVVTELRKLGKLDNADKLERILAIRDAGKKE